MRNLTMMTDLYELTMMNGYLRFGMENNRRLLRYLLSQAGRYDRLCCGGRS